MGLGKRIRLNRLFAHPSGRMCAVAVDHFSGYQGAGLPPGLRDIPALLARIVPEAPDAVVMHRGTAKNAWPPHAGRVPLIVSSVFLTNSDGIFERLARPETVLRMGGEAIAAAIGVRGPHEARSLRLLAEIVEEADRIELPVIAHIYPRDFSDGPRYLHDPESIGWAVRCGIECGVDVIKVPYTGDADSYRQIIDACPVPVVAAGGPQCRTLDDALAMMHGVVASGARGATIGRNIWGTGDPAAALRALKAVIHGEG